MTRRNTLETSVAFLGLGMVVYGGRIQEGTLTGSVVFVVGFVVCWIGIAPWKFYARNYVCLVCRDSFGGGKEGPSRNPRTSRRLIPASTDGATLGRVLQRF